MVPTVAHIADAEALLEQLYEVAYRRPKKDQATHKKASSFDFDDLRLYLKRGASATGRNDDLEGLIFEVQVKTVLQYAWGKATHDLIYKTDQVSWPKERIAFQVKAMLEHAEIAIAEAERLAEASAIAKCDKETAATLQIIAILKEFWPKDRLPTDIKRLSESVRGVLAVCAVPPEQLENILQAEKARIGLLPTDLSPYAFLVQALAHSAELDLQAELGGGRSRRTKIFVHGDMELPDWMLEPHERIIRV